MSYSNVSTPWFPLQLYTSASGGTLAIKAGQVIDLSSGSTSLALIVQVPFFLIQWGGLVTEIIGTGNGTTGGFTSTGAVMSVSRTPSGGSIAEVSRITFASTGFTVDAMVTGATPGVTESVTSPNQRFNTGDTITFKSVTGGTGGVTTGDIFPIIFAEFFWGAP